MAATTTANPADVANRYQQYFAKQLLLTTVNVLRLQEFAKMVDLPRNAGSTSVTFFRRRAADSSQVQSLAEGVPISTYTEVTTEKVQVTLAQLGQAYKQSDIITWTDIYDWLKTAIETMGEDAALKCADILRAAIMTDATYGLLNSNGNQERFAGQLNTGNSAADFAAVLGLNAPQAKWSRTGALFCVTQLRKNKTPKIGSGYVSAVAPEVIHDAVQDKDWLDAAKYSTPDKLAKGEIGTLDGIRYIDDTNPHRENVYGTYSATGSVYTSLYFGKDAYGLTKLAGTSSPKAPSMTILRNADKSDLLNQFVLAGWKAYYQAICLNKAFIVAYRTKSTFA